MFIRGQHSSSWARIMNSRSKKNAIFLAAMLSATVVPMAPASAANNLMELLFGNRRVESRPVDQTHQVHPGRLQDASVRRPNAPIKRVVVTAPTNYDYKPEGLVLIDFSKVDTQITASADHVARTQAGRRPRGNACTRSAVTSPEGAS